MRLFILPFFFVLSLFSLNVTAGSGHSHGHGHSHGPVSQETANLKAKKIIINLIKQNVINKNWGSTTVSSSEKKIFNGKEEWVVSFVNKEITDDKKRKLYIFLTLDGSYIAANYTGK